MFYVWFCNKKDVRKKGETLLYHFETILNSHFKHWLYQITWFYSPLLFFSSYHLMAKVHSLQENFNSNKLSIKETEYVYFFFFLDFTTN